MKHKKKHTTPLCVTCESRSVCKDPCNPSSCEFHQDHVHHCKDLAAQQVFQECNIAVEFLDADESEIILDVFSETNTEVKSE